MENRQNKPPEGGAASGHGGQKFHTDSEQAKLHKSKLRMESREERLNKARERLAKQKPPKKPGPIKRIARIAGHETHAFLPTKIPQISGNPDSAYPRRCNLPSAESVSEMVCKPVLHTSLHK